MRLALGGAVAGLAVCGGLAVSPIAAGVAAVAVTGLLVLESRRRWAFLASSFVESLAVLLLWGLPVATWLLAAVVVRAILWWRERDRMLADPAEAPTARRWFPWVGALGSALPLLFLIFTGRAASLAYAAAVLALVGGWIYKLQLVQTRASTSASDGNPRVAVRE